MSYKELLVKVVWRFASITRMEVSVILFGMMLMHLWFASSVDFLPMVLEMIDILGCII